jgi:hypothetical protein
VELEGRIRHAESGEGVSSQNDEPSAAHKRLLGNGGLRQGSGENEGNHTRNCHALATSLTGLANVGMTVPEDGAVVVPHGSTVVSHEDVNVDVDSDEVRSVDKNEVRAGHGHDNPKTK